MRYARTVQMYSTFQERIEILKLKDNFKALITLNQMYSICDRRKKNNYIKILHLALINILQNNIIIIAKYLFVCYQN